MNDLVDNGGADEAINRCPRLLAGSEQLMFGRDGTGRFEARIEGAPRPWPADSPVVLIDWHAATAYARWLSEKSGKDWRLPNELEREKAARGADGRIFPWGDETDATFACASESFVRNPHRVPVRDYAYDESPYGVRGLAGNVRDWCINIWRRDGAPIQNGRLILDDAQPDDSDFMVVKRGGWASPISFSRSATRFGTPPGSRYIMIGIRLVRPHPRTA